MSSIKYEINTRTANMPNNKCIGVINDEEAKKVNMSVSSYIGGNILKKMDKDSMVVIVSPFLLLADTATNIRSDNLEEVLLESKKINLKKPMTRKLIKPDDKGNNGGYIITGLLVLASIFVLGMIIFNIIKYILG